MLVNYEFIKRMIQDNKREDNRTNTDYRDIEVEVNKIPQANGSARVKLGDTEVIAGVKLAVGTPYPDTPNQGMFMVNMELSPLASPNFETGPPRESAIEISRVVDRAIRESETIDFEKLSIVSGEKAWMVNIDIQPINDGGNLFDTAVIAAVIALKNAKFPEYDKKTEQVKHETRTKKGITLRNLPIMVTQVKIGDKLVVDPNSKEETIMETRIHIATLENGDICAMQKGLEASLTEEQINEAIDVAIAKGKDLRKLLKKY